jgi:hypothetical protein
MNKYEPYPIRMGLNFCLNLNEMWYDKQKIKVDKGKFLNKNIDKEGTCEI